MARAHIHKSEIGIIFNIQETSMKSIVVVRI